MAELYWTDKNGRKWHVCSCQKAWLTAYENEMLRLGIIKHSLDLYQTIGGAAASGGTHARGGATDLGQVSLAAVTLARQMGADASWHRPYNWDGRKGMEHHHSVLRGCPHMVPVAGYQYSSTKYGVDHGHNGLANGGRDTGPPLSHRTWEEGIAWAKAQAAGSETPVTSATFNFLGFNIYASQYTGGGFSAKRKAALKATFAGPSGANASWNSLSEVNSNLDHNTVVALLGAQFNHEDTYVRAKGNNHHYPDANKWQLTGKLEVDLKSTTNQERRITLATAKHKATGIVVSSWVTHFSSATHGATPVQATVSQIVEAKAVARIISGKPLPGWDLAKSFGYADTNFDEAEGYIEPVGVKEIAKLVTITNGQLKSLHTLGKAPENGYRRDNVYVGSKVTVDKARQIINLYDASDHLGQACTFTVAK